MLLQVRDLSLSLRDTANSWFWSKGIPVNIFNGINFEVDVGQSLGIVGESGSGKTSLAKTIVRLYQPSRGSLLFDGVDISSLRENELGSFRSKVQFIFQDALSALNPRQTIAQIISNTLMNFSIETSKSAALTHAGKLLDRVGLPRSYLSRYPHQLSGGQRQRVGIARAIAPKPKLIVADEIVSGLDVSTQAQILALLRELREDGSLIFISHDLSVVRVLCDHVLVLREGKQEELGKTAELFDNPQSRYTRDLLAAIPLPEYDPTWLGREVERKTRDTEECMKIQGAVVFVTGTNRGIGAAFVQNLISRGASKIYIAARDTSKLQNLVSEHAGKLVPVELDITNDQQIARAVAGASDVNLLINNAGVNGNSALISANDLASARDELDVNYFGTLAMCRAFAPVLKKNGGGAIINILSILSRVNLPACGSYCVSKSAALSMTQGVRAELAGQKTLVVGVMPGAVDTDMAKSFEGPKENPNDVANASLDAVEQGTEDVYPGGMAQGVSQGLAGDPKAVEKEFAAYLPG